jgi:hypothetical protein
MSLQITSLTQLDTAKVESMIATMSQLMAERHPEVELTRGAFHDLVLYFDGVLNAAIQENIDRVLRSKSLLQITKDPTLADTDLVDQVLSNFNITRDAGTPAVGTATVILNLPVLTTISAAARFTADTTGAVFVPAEAFTILPPNVVATASNQRTMIPVGDGTYAATIVLQAIVAGTTGNINRGVTLLPNSAINNTNAVYAATDFISGRDAISNEEYLTKLSAGLAAKTIGGRQNYVAAILNQKAFANTASLSVVGCGDPEQQRDQHSLFPISGGGKVDIYAQTNGYAQETEQLLSATYVGPVSGGTKWQIILPRDSAPGFYEVTRIAAPKNTNVTGYGVTLDVRNVDLSNLTFVPDIMYIAEGAYTRYQTAVIQFDDTDTPTTGLVAGTTKKLYAVRTIGMPLIAELQDFLSSRDVRARGSDVLVKAPVPCFTKIAFDIRKEASDATPDIAAIQQAVSAAISKIGFSGQLHASVISNVAHKYLTGRQALSSIDMFGRIRRPDGTTTYVRDNTMLVIPSDYNRGVSGRTTAFLTRPEDVAVSVVTAGFIS